MNIHYTTQFKKDYKRIKKQNKNPNQLKVVIDKLVAGEQLEQKYKDWILIYRIENEDLILERTGSHSELFKK